MLDHLSKYKIILASKSPRRKELLSQLRIPFTTVTLSGIDETYPENLKATEIPEFLAEKKASEYRKRFTDNELIITADTLVILGDVVLGKPKDTEDAFKILSKLSGKVHKVITGVSISTVSETITFSSCTEVKFAEISDKDIVYYVNTFRPLDKAGAYGIQEWIGCVAVEWIKGSYYNVMGLPVHSLYEQLKKFQ